MEPNGKLTIAGILAEIEQFNDDNPLGHDSTYPSRLIRDYAYQQEREHRINMENALIEAFGTSLPQVVSALSSRTKYVKEKYVRDFASAHEMYGVLAEEVHELFLEVCKNEASRDNQKIRAEAMDIAVVCVRFLAEEKAKFPHSSVC